ncbi:MAG TPA: DUF1465 family protein [Sphingomonas sp.]|nr:DUF1465 family protein [Sphingomonas sp.]
MPLTAHRPLTDRLIDSLYVEAMLLADEARGYFDEEGRFDRERLPPILRVGFSCESLRVTTRLMHIIAWLLTRRAVAAGEISETRAAAPERRLGAGQPSDPVILAGLPERARQIIEATVELHARIARLDSASDPQAPSPSPARTLFARLESVF